LHSQGEVSAAPRKGALPADFQLLPQNQEGAMWWGMGGASLIPGWWIPCAR